MRTTSRRSRLVAPAVVLLIAFTAAGAAIRWFPPKALSGVELSPPVHVQVAPDRVFEPGGIPVTNTLAGALLSTVVVTILFTWLRFGRSGVAAGARAHADTLLVLAHDQVAAIVGEKQARWLFPVAATILIIIIVNSWIALTPVFGPITVETSAGETDALFRGAGTDINFSLALAVAALVAVQVAGFSALRRDYLRKFIDFSGFRRRQYFQGITAVFTGVLFVFTELSRVLSFTFRLFGAMTAGEILLLVAGFLLPTVFPVVFYGLEMAVGLMHGLIFAALTVIFARVAAARDEPAGTGGSAGTPDE